MSLFLFPLLIFVSTLASYLMVRQLFYGLLLGAPVLWVLAAFAGILQRFDFISSPLITFFLLAAITGLVGFLRKRDLKDLIFGIAIAGVGSALAVVIEVVTRQLRLGGVYFGDVPTILGNAVSVSQGGNPFLGLFVSLKRSVGTYSVHALGYSFEGEYLVAYHPYIFVLALIGIFGLCFKVIGNFYLAGLFTLLGLGLIASTEAILRHLYFINSQAGLMLLTSVLCSLMFADSKLNMRPILAVALVSSGILRPDYGAIMLVLTAMLVLRKNLAISNRERVLAVGLVVIPIYLLGISSGLQLTGVEILVFTSLAVFSGTVISLFGIVLSKLKPRPEQVIVFVFWSLVILISIELLNSEAAASPLITNFFMFEGLWGFTAYFMVAMSLVSFLFSIRDYEHKVLLEVFLLTLLMLLGIKLADVFLTADSGFGLARVGWGDSVNRLMIAILPIAAVSAAQVLSSIFSQNEPRLMSDNTRKS